MARPALALTICILLVAVAYGGAGRAGAERRKTAALSWIDGMSTP
jgi:hypothetical protein